MQTHPATLKHGVSFPIGNEIDITSRAMKALSHPVRLQIVKHLAQGELSVTELIDRIPTHSQSSISQHLASLFKNGIVSSRRQGTLHFYQINDWRTCVLVRMIVETFCPASAEQASDHNPTTEALSAA